MHVQGKVTSIQPFDDYVRVEVSISNTGDDDDDGDDEFDNNDNDGNDGNDGNNGNDGNDSNDSNNDMDNKNIIAYTTDVCTG